MQDKTPHKPHSFLKFWGLSIWEGINKSWQHYGWLVQLSGVALGIGLLWVRGYSRRHPNFDLAGWEEFVNFWVAVTPLFLVAMWVFLVIAHRAYKIYRESEKNYQKELERNAPKFKLSCSPNLPGCVISNPRDDQKFLRLKVQTDCPDGIRECRGFLNKIEKDGIAIFEGDARELPFARAELEDSLSKIITQKNEYHLDVLVIYRNPQIVCFATKVHEEAMDKNHKYAFSEEGSYILTVSVSGTPAPTQSIQLKFKWTGHWETASIDEHHKSATFIVDGSK